MAGMKPTKQDSLNVLMKYSDQQIKGFYFIYRIDIKYLLTS